MNIMRIYSRLQGPKLFIALLICFSFLNFNCTELSTTSPRPSTNPDIGNKNPVAYIEILKLWAAQQSYDLCVKNNQRCDKEKVALAGAQSVARGIVFPPFPVPPNPCEPIGNCNDLRFLDYLIYPVDHKYRIKVFDAISGKLIAENDPGSAMKSKDVDGYVTTRNKKLVSNFSGLAKVEIANLGTNEVHAFEMKMGK